MGPGVKDEETLRKLIQSGMDVARYNFSHGTHEEHKARMDQLKKIRAEEKKPVAILLDTKGPEIRTGVLKGGEKITLKAGQTFILTPEEIEGDETKVSISYEGLVDDVQAGSRILVDDGLIELNVKGKQGRDIVCSVVNGGELGERKGVNVPNVPVRLPAITEKDKEDIKFGVEQKIDFIAASFVRNAECILEIRAYPKELKAPYIPIIAKIENAEGIQNIDEIIRCADGIMVARGDLGVEIPAENVPYLQKMIIQKCNDNYRPVITATQMLDSMIRNPRPTRAEVTDVATAVYDGTDAVMLSGETAQGKYPVEAVQMMAKIAESSEQFLKFDMYRDTKALLGKQNVSSAVGFAAVTMVERLNASCIVTPTMSGQTARVISNLRPSVPIYGVTPNERTRRKMQLYWGVKPITGYEEDSTENIISHAMYMVVREGLVHKGEMVIFTAGDPATNEVSGQGYMTNMLQVIQAK